jgi:DNA mismatch endonuclease (patch repair protein)
VPRTTPSYSGLRPASPRASAAARGSSRKVDTRPEVQLRQLLHHAGRRFRKNVRSLPGCPDIVFPGAKLAVFCDGDFWHGRDWAERKSKLARGANRRYWIPKIERNMERDQENQLHLESNGWRVLRFWESEILRNAQAVLAEISGVLDGLE